MSRGGFTILEVVVVAGIVALLAGLITVGIIYSRGKAILLKCLANHHAIYAATMMYVADYNGYLPLVYYDKHVLRDCACQRCSRGTPFRVPPPPKDYYIDDALGDYVESREVFFCPAVRPRDPRAYPWCPGSGYYSWNPYAVDLRIDEIKPPLSHCGIMTCGATADGYSGHIGQKFWKLYLDGHVSDKGPGCHYPFRGPWSFEFFAEETRGSSPPAKPR